MKILKLLVSVAAAMNIILTPVSAANEVNVIEGQSPQGEIITLSQENKNQRKHVNALIKEELLEKAKIEYLKKIEEEKAKINIVACDNLYDSKTFKKIGVIRYGKYKWTWYSQRVLPGGGLKIPGRHVDENGYICDAEGYICLASSELAQGTVINSPFGKKGKVYDSGCAKGVLDVYVDF